MLYKAYIHTIQIKLLSLGERYNIVLFTGITAFMETQSAFV